MNLQSEELKFNFYDGVTNINPLFGFCFTRDALAASQSIVEKFVERTLLYDFYGELLTDHQKEIYEQFILEDLSLGEITRDAGISRQGVHDLIKRVTKTLDGYEAKLHLIQKFLETKDKVSKIDSLVDDYMESQDISDIHEIKKLSNEILEEF